MRDMTKSILYENLKISVSGIKTVVLYFVFVKVVLYAGINKKSHIMPEHSSLVTSASSLKYNCKRPA